MLIIGTFEYSIELEQALVMMEHNGIYRRHIMVVPMNTSPTSSTQYIGVSRDRYYKGIEVGMACATALSVVGMSVGLILKMGPIFGALAFAIAGFIVAFGIYLYINRNTDRHLPKKLPEVTIIVQCNKDKSITVMETMWKYRALTVGHFHEINNNV